MLGGRTFSIPPSGPEGPIKSFEGMAKTDGTKVFDSPDDLAGRGLEANDCTSIHLSGASELSVRP